MFELEFLLVQLFKFLPIFLEAFLVAIILLVLEQLFEISLADAAGCILPWNRDLLRRGWCYRYGFEAVMALSFDAISRDVLFVLQGPLLDLCVDPAIVLLALLHEKSILLLTMELLQVDLNFRNVCLVATSGRLHTMNITVIIYLVWRALVLLIGEFKQETIIIVAFILLVLAHVSYDAVVDEVWHVCWTDQVFLH